MITDPEKLKLEENKFARRGFEIISAKGKVCELNRDIVLYCLYLPPNLTSKKAEEASAIINEDVGRMKLKLKDPLILIGGDVNQFGINGCIANHPEFDIVAPLPTRGNACLDMITCNFIDSINANITVPPLPVIVCQTTEEY